MWIKARNSGISQVDKISLIEFRISVFEFRIFRVL